MRLAVWLLCLSLLVVVDGTSVYAAGTRSAEARSVGRAKARTQARVHFERGLRNIARGRYLEAVGELQRAYQLHPNVTALYHIGRAYQAAKRKTEATAAYYRYLAYAPRGHKYRAPAKRALRAMKMPVPPDPPPARPAARETAARPAVVSTASWEKRARAHFGLRDPAAARFLPESLVVRQRFTGRSPEARLQARREQRLRQHGERLFKQRKWVPAYRVYRQLVRLRPADLDLRERLGVLQAVLGDFGGALRTVATIHRLGGEVRAERARQAQRRALLPPRRRGRAR